MRGRALVLAGWFALGCSGAPASAPSPAVAPTARPAPHAAPVAPAPATGTLTGTVEGPAARAYVRVLGPAGVLAATWTTETEKTFTVPDLPAGTPLVVTAWAPGAISAAAESLLPLLGTPAYAERFAGWQRRDGCTLLRGGTGQVALTMVAGQPVRLRVRVTGVPADPPPPELWVELMLCDPDTEAEVHSIEYVEAQWRDGTFVGRTAALTEAGVEVVSPCVCALAIRVRARVPGYRPFERIWPMPTENGPVPIDIPLASLRQGTYGRVVDDGSDDPVPGALVRWFGEPPASDGPPRPGDAPPDPEPWAAWLEADATDAAGRFALTALRYHGPLVAVVPGLGCSDWLDPATHEGPIELRVVAGNAVSGVVRDAATGEPAVGVTVVLAHHDAAPPPDADGWFDQAAPPAAPDTRRGVGPAVVTDAAGRYRFAGVPPGWCVVPEVWRSERGRPVAAAAGVPFTGARDDDGAFDPADTQAWIEQRVAAGELLRFDGTGGAVARDLTAEVRPGVAVTWTLVVTDGGDPPDAAEVVHEHVLERPRRPTDHARRERREVTERLDEEIAVQVNGERTRIAVRRVERMWWDAEAGARTVRCYLPVGRNRITVHADGFRSVRLPMRIVAADGPDEADVLPLARK